MIEGVLKRGVVMRERLWVGEAGMSLGGEWRIHLLLPRVRNWLVTASTGWVRRKRPKHCHGII